LAEGIPAGVEMSDSPDRRLSRRPVSDEAAIMAWSEDKVERLIDRYVKRDELMLDRIRRMEKSSIGFDPGS
jgi:hypothetical protein